jgi:hypothetical protein
VVARRRPVPDLSASVRGLERRRHRRPRRRDLTLEYLEWLGIEGIWLDPIHPSPNVDWGYDVADYLSVHPDLGTLDDLDRLVEAAAERGIRVLLTSFPTTKPGEACGRISSMDAPSVIIPPPPGLGAEREGGKVVVRWTLGTVHGDCPPA